MARPTDSNEQLLCSSCGKSQRQVKKLIAGIKSIAVRSYEFDSDFAYSKDDVDKVRAQLAACRLGERRFVELLDRYGKGVVQEHDALPGREQVMYSAGHEQIGPDRTGHTAALQSEAGQVMAQDRVERSPMLGPEPLLRSGLRGSAADRR